MHLTTVHPQSLTIDHAFSLTMACSISAAVVHGSTKRDPLDVSLSKTNWRHANNFWFHGAVFVRLRLTHFRTSKPISCVYRLCAYPWFVTYAALKSLKSYVFIKVRQPLRRRSTTIHRCFCCVIACVTKRYYELLSLSAFVFFAFAHKWKVVLFLM
jgi:hypothetical protein